MRVQSLSLLVAIGFVAALATSVRADDKPGKTTVKTTTTEIKYEGDFNGCRGSKVVGADVDNTSGQDLGKIKDVVVDPESGRVAYAVLSFGGFMGVGNKLFAIPWRSLKMQADDKLILDVEKAQLEAAKGFDEDNWPDMANQQWATETHKHFGQEPYWSVEVKVEGIPALQTSRLSKLIGHGVDNNADKKLGEINDVILDSNRGQIAYAVLGVGGFVGIGEDLVAVPWEKLDVTQVNNDTTVRLAMTEDEIKNGPHFPRDKWPDVDDKTYLIRVYTFYDTDPYWTKNGRRVTDARNP
jgi:sporulation protein YlmC with PRC-barrel domain